MSTIGVGKVVWIISPQKCFANQLIERTENMKLYEYSATRSIRCRWLLEELEVPFEAIEIDLSEGAHHSEEFLQINPNGKIPVLTDEKITLFESAAICTYLADKFSDKNLIPQQGTPNRALYDQWMFFCMTELEQPLWTITKHTFLYSEEKRSRAAISLAMEDFAPVAKLLDDYLKDRHYMIGNTFSVADIMICHTLIWAFAYNFTKHLNLLDGKPSLIRYIKFISQRERLPKTLKDMISEKLASREADETVSESRQSLSAPVQ